MITVVSFRFQEARQEMNKEYTSWSKLCHYGFGFSSITSVGDFLSCFQSRSIKGTCMLLNFGCSLCRHSALICSRKATDREHGTKKFAGRKILGLRMHHNLHSMDIINWWVLYTCLIVRFTYLAPTSLFCYILMSPKPGCLIRTSRS